VSDTSRVPNNSRSNWDPTKLTALAIYAWLWYMQLPGNLSDIMHVIDEVDPKNPLEIAAALLYATLINL
jgi:hypothetical protein